MDNKELLEKLLNTNLLPLAFIGDGVHTLFVREKVLNQNINKMDNYHKDAAKFCKASTQAKVIKALIDNLSPDEQDIVRRGRNAKPKHHAKNASTADYSYATSFEILIGYLYLSENTERLTEILNFSIQENFDKIHS